MTTSTNDQADGHMIKPLLLEPVSAQSDTEVTADRGDAGGDPLAAVGYPVWQPLRSQLRNALDIRTPMNETEAETGHSNLSFHGQWFFHQSRH
jgi:hypothetical protein